MVTRRDRVFDLQRSAQWVLHELTLSQPLTERELTALASRDQHWDGVPMPERGKRVGVALKMLRDAGRIEKRLERKPGTPPRAEWITAGHNG